MCEKEAKHQSTLAAPVSPDQQQTLSMSSMSNPPFLGLAPPLPPGWTVHQAPGGQPYYYNSTTKESTYTRPIPTFQNLPPPQQSSSKKKEKPLLKTQIPGTDWLRVKTTEGNIFYSHKVKKHSVWSVPDEIKDAVLLLEKQEKEKEADPKHDKETEEMLEVERVKNQVQELVKRKAVEDVPLDDVVITKKARVEDEKDEDEEDESDESEEEEWQREAAAQLAAEAEEEKKRAEEEAKREAEAAEAEAKRAKEPQLNMPERVDLSVEEAKALFKTLLREKDINPLHPWDTSLPKFVSDPRYVLLPSVSARREAFDEYCRDRARELRQQTVKKEVGTPKEEFESLLHAEVKSTRTSWTDFRRTWKKDRRFYGWGRDDREREKRFRDFVRELGEKKKAAAKKAEDDFFALLKERTSVKEGSVWKEIKKDLVQDPRYDAVGSSSLREELFNTFLKAKFGSPSHTHPDSSESSNQKQDDLNKAESRKERKERAVKEREEKVRAEKERLEASIGQSRMDLNKEEGERDFKTMLTDAIRDPQMTWNNAQPQLQRDPRFRNSPLPVNQQFHLFHEHVGRLRAKHIDSLHALFGSHSTLATPFYQLPLSSLLSSVPVTRLGLNEDALRHEFEKWQRERTHVARKEFDQMLSENSFVDFWGRLNKIGGEGVDGGVQAEDLGEDEGEGGGGKVDMKALAKNVDVEEMEKVLRNDKRYTVFNHIPEQRELWIRDYLAKLSAPKLSVHVPSSNV